jgi:cobyrinic acid a,c-diamide synthase
MAILIAGERSGVGKTTVTLALLSALCKGKAIQRQYFPQLKSHQPWTVQSFKVGPDYIDPIFHQRVTDRPCRNLDPVLTSEDYVRSCFAHHSQDADFVVVEGVMGLFDGVYWPEAPERCSCRDATPWGSLSFRQTDFASTAHIARLLNLPVALVIDCSRLSGSIAALVQGYRTWDSQLQFAGVILNRVGSDRHRHLLTTALEPLNLPILGLLHRQDQITIPDRHLGLIPTDELPAFDRLIDRLAHLGESCFDWQKLLEFRIPNSEFRTPNSEFRTPNSEFRIQKIAIAHDRAFNFYYADNLDLLRAAGAELVFWSPIADPGLPDGVSGLYLGGGFPEVFAEALAENLAARESVAEAICAGLPTYAECGGLMYLCEQVVDFEGRSYPMVGILPAIAQMNKPLTLGYRQVVAQQASPLVTPGMVLWGHEFHRSQLTASADQPLFSLRGLHGQEWDRSEGWLTYQLHASYVHLHWGATPQIPQRFLQHCQKFKKEKP